MLANTATNKVGLETLVRSFVHYNNLTKELNKQATASRKLKDRYETDIIHNLQANNMLNASIQTNNSVLTVVKDSVSPSLSMTAIRDYLDGYFKQKGANFNETDAIMQYIESRKKDGAKVGLKLKETVAVPKPSFNV
jgi:hypothetical protein